MKNIEICPTCGQIWPEDRRQTIEDLKKSCVQNGWPVYPGGRVNEAVAAALLGRAVGTLRNWRYGERPLPFTRPGAGRGRVTYRLSDIADFLDCEAD